MESTVGEQQADSSQVEELEIVGEVDPDLVDHWLELERRAFCNGLSPSEIDGVMRLLVVTT